MVCCPVVSASPPPKFSKIPEGRIKSQHSFIHSMQILVSHLPRARNWGNGAEEKQAGSVPVGNIHSGRD